MNCKIMIAATLYCICSFGHTFSEQVLFHFSDERNFFLHLPPTTTVSRIVDILAQSTGFARENLVIEANGRILHRREKISTYDGQELWVHMSSGLIEDAYFVPKNSHEGYRKYQVPVTEKEKKDIHYILKSMAKKNLVSLWNHKKKLEGLGKRIDHIHPLRFLECVFLDEELKVYIYNIKNRGSWIWSEFIKGIKESLQEEADIGNMKDEFLIDFSQRISVDLNAFYAAVVAQKWEQFIKTLVNIVPRSGDPGRYDQ